MGEGAEHATVEEATLALYLLGALDEPDRIAFERHLAGCDRCLAEAGELGGLTSTFGELSDADVAELLAYPPPPSSQRSGPRQGTVSRQRSDSQRVSPPGRRDAARRRRRSTAWVVTVAAAVAALVVAVVVVQGQRADHGQQGGLALVATGQAPGSGVSLSVTVTGDAQSSTVRATVSGLRSGVRYRLYAVTRDGDTHVVRDWTGAAGTQQVTGDVTQPVDSLAFFTVGQVDGPPIVTAPVQHGPGATPSR